jgi:hypothetical protein
MSSNNVTLAYSGGSGGFLILHLLLLSNQFVSLFDTQKSLTEIVQEQWTIQDHTRWKQNEYWPNNASTRQAHTDLRRLYFVCNPGFGPGPGCNDDYNNYSQETTAIVYTDIESQNELCFFKRAHWYIHTSTQGQKNNNAITTGVPYGTELVDPGILPFLQSADIVIKLQQVVNTGGKILEELFEIPAINTQQHLLLQRWKQLHPDQLLQKIGIH